ncbi:MAG TPA: ComEA family DNA-binding protein [Actinomycetota bacterium]
MENDASNSAPPSSAEPQPTVLGLLRARLLDALRFSPREVVVLGLLAALVVTGAVLAYVRARPVASSAALTPAAASSSEPAAAGLPIVVHVVGEVKRPGVYELLEGDRVIDAVRAAGGFVKGADRGAINLARPLADGEQVVIPAKSRGSAPAGADEPGLVNINTASQADLESLPGIGPVLAQRIMDYREQHGGFRSVEDLKNVSGIGDKTFASLEPLVTV